MKDLFECHSKAVSDVLTGQSDYTFVTGDSQSILRGLPNACIDCVVTSPPYFHQREYDFDLQYEKVAIGLEKQLDSYITNLVSIFTEVRRLLKPGGSLWLNIGDKFENKELVGVPWRVALALKDHGWILRQDVIWHKMKGTQSSKDKFRHLHEHIFHFVKNRRYFFDADAVRIAPKPAMSRNGKIVSATGVSGKKYYKYIESTDTLTDTEREQAKIALDNALEEVKAGDITDFRMTIRGAQRTYHGNKSNMSGRAKELETKGFFILKMSAKGFLPSDVWNIVPEDKWRKDNHCAVFPEELVTTPILCTTPKRGLVLDPFSGTGTTVFTAVKNGFRGLGFDISEEYNKLAYKRMNDV
ncbi:MAG: site-specific DNA-methyltransferase [Gammaproteobacteria bacterium]|nr:site-specific DNA-methyltransferase [Gammaproteobacteria bacterium]